MQLLKKIREVPKIYYIAFISVSIIIILITSLSYLYFKRNFIRKELDSYYRITYLQSSSISKFISERMMNAQLINDNPFASQIIKNIYYNPHTSAEEKKAWLLRFNVNKDYYTLALYDRKMNLVYTIFENPESLLPPIPVFFRKSMDSKAPLLGSPYICSNCKRLHLDFFAPIIESKKGNSEFLILLRVDLWDYIIPRINMFNLNEFDAYSVILFSDSFAINLAHGIERIAFDSTTVDRIKKGEKRFDALLYDRKYYILSVPVDNTDWFFVSCVPAKFVSDKLSPFLAFSAITCLFLILTILISLYTLFLGNLKKTTENDLTVEKERQTLMKHLDYLLDMADDMIFLLDHSGFVKYANKSAIKHYQDANRPLLGLHFNDIASKGSRDVEMKFDRFFDSSVGESGAILRSEHRLAGGKTVPVEIRAKKFLLYNETYYQFVIRDISERIRFEDDLRDSNAKLSESIETMKKANAQLKSTEQERVHHINLLMKNEKQLEEYSLKTRRILDNIQECVIIYKSQDGENFVISDLNRAVERTEQVFREKIIGKNIEEVFPGVRSFGLFEVLKRVYNTGMDAHKEASVYRDERISGVRENFVHKLSSDEILVIYREMKNKES